jgi:CMP-N,N'-diacetyllegionaminic acid synthase
VSEAGRRYLAVVTARSGSKRLPEKNVRDFCGRPLFVWSVRAGLECPAVQRTVVSTDSPEYRRIALDAGAECPRLRAPELAADTASSVDTVLEAVDWFDGAYGDDDAVVLLQPTSPLRDAADVEAAIEMFERTGAPALVSVSPAECPPEWMGQLTDDLRADDFIARQRKGSRSQDLGQWYRLNGAIYVIRIGVLRAERGFLPAGTVAFPMPRMRAVDIDDATDFEFARLLMQARLTQAD